MCMCVCVCGGGKSMSRKGRVTRDGMYERPLLKLVSLQYVVHSVLDLPVDRHVCRNVPCAPGRVLVPHLLPLQACRMSLLTYRQKSENAIVDVNSECIKWHTAVQRRKSCYPPRESFQINVQWTFLQGGGWKIFWKIVWTSIVRRSCPAKYQNVHRVFLHSEWKCGH